MSKPSRKVKEKGKDTSSVNVPLSISDKAKKRIERILGIKILKIYECINLAERKMYTTIEFRGDVPVSNTLVNSIEAIASTSPIKEYSVSLEKNDSSDDWERRLFFKSLRVEVAPNKYADVLAIGGTLPSRYDPEFNIFIKSLPWKETKRRWDPSDKTWKIDNFRKPDIFDKLCKGLGFIPKIDGLSEEALESIIEKILE